MDTETTRAALVREWAMDADPDTAVCPFRAGAKLHDGPDVFFKGGEAHVRAAGLGGNWNYGGITGWNYGASLLYPQTLSASAGYQVIIPDGF